MPGRYSVSGQDTCTASTSQIGVYGTAAVRPSIHYLMISSGASPADNAALFLAGRVTSAGTATAVTPQALDPADPAAVSLGKVNWTAEPTYTANANMLRVAVNQRATFQWYSVPGGEIIIPATADNGVALLASAANSAFVADYVMHFQE